MTDFSHLNALEFRLSNERIHLQNAKTVAEKDLRAVWVKQLQDEIAAEYKFLGVEPVTIDENLTMDDIFAELEE